MSDTVISVEHLSKSYLVGHRFAQREHGATFREMMTREVRNFARKALDLVHGRQIIQGDQIEEFWALKNVSFDVKQGEVLGIIGRNGAGKSTLLKILSRITEPTEGRATLRGRVSSLLEVGTGFHQELTGRENIYLNGAILGMTRREIDRKFDEIVAFAEVEQFLDTPVKRYSSGMYVRLAFAVAAHLEPEILIVDEVLAVGDAQFQKKCLGKMQEISEISGRTVLFVSHNIGMITSLCTTAIQLENGRITANGKASEVAAHYFAQGQAAPAMRDYTNENRPVGDDLAVLRWAGVFNDIGKPISEIDIRKPFKLKMRYETFTRVPIAPYPNFHLRNERGEQVLFASGNRRLIGGDLPGCYEAECLVPGRLLNDGTYFFSIALTFTHTGGPETSFHHVSFHEKDALSIVVVDPIEETLEESRNGYSGSIPGIVRPRLDWTISRVG